MDQRTLVVALVSILSLAPLKVGLEHREPLENVLPLLSRAHRIDYFLISGSYSCPIHSGVLFGRETQHAWFMRSMKKVFGCSSAPHDHVGTV